MKRTRSKKSRDTVPLTAKVGTPATTETFAKVRKLTTAGKSNSRGGSSSRNTSNSSDASHGYQTQ
jgi:hypothetical protein